MSVPRRMAQAFSLHDEDGMTTVGMVVSLLLALSMIFSSAQVYRIQSVSSRVQSVADAGALAAGNVVAEFMVAVRVCDSVALSLSLTSLTSTGLGVVACCVPGGQGVGAKLLEAGARVADARDSFSKTASEGLTRVQKALPFLAAASAASVAQGNGSNGSDYTALALLVPDSAEDIRVPQEDARAKQAREDAIGQAEEVKELARRAEEAALRAQDAKQRAFDHDCGARPGWCMAERAETLAHMTGAQNPVYSSVDAWSFSVALRRAQAYYPARLAVERPDDGSVQAQAQSALRKRFYTYAAKEVARGYVREGDSFEALFPRLPANTAQMRGTELFVQAVYPVSVTDASPILHAWDGCPKAAGSTSRASLHDMEAGAWETCSECGFTAASLGKVAAASTSIGNGFEHHYEQVALAAEEYQKALEEGAPAKREAKSRVSKLLDQLRDACSSGIVPHRCGSARGQGGGLPCGEYGPRCPRQGVRIRVRAGQRPAGVPCGDIGGNAGGRSVRRGAKRHRLFDRRPGIGFGACGRVGRCSGRLVGGAERLCRWAVGVGCGCARGLGGLASGERLRIRGLGRRCAFGCVSRRRASAGEPGCAAPGDGEHGACRAGRR